MSQLTHPKPQALRLRIPPRVWLAVVTLIAGAAIALFFVISGGDEATQTPNTAVTETAAGIRYDGGPEEGTRGAVAARQPGVRYDGGPEEGSRGALSSDAPSNASPGTRYDGGPEEGSRGSGR
jgi:hypothetical protein